MHPHATSPTSARTLLSVASLAGLALAAPALAQEAKPQWSPAKNPQIADMMDQSNQAANPASAAPAKPAPAIPDLTNLLAFDSMIYGVGENGAIFARGKNYKAAFTAEGMTFTPRGGTGDLAMRLHSASAGGKVVALDAQALPQRDGDSVSFDRGAIIEHYRLTPESIEQLFTINAMPAAGDLVLRVAATAPTMNAAETASDDAAALEFASAAGAVKYTKAVLVDAADARTALDTTVAADGMIEIRVPAATLKRAAFPITVDPVITSTHAYGDELLYRRPDIAFDVTSNVFAVVFEYEFSSTDGDIYGVKLTPEGAVVPNSLVAVEISGANWRKPSIANNNIANNFLVVAETGFAPSRLVKGCVWNPVAGTVNAPFQVSSSPSGDQFNADVGGDPSLDAPTYYLVAWEREFNANDHDIHAQLVTSAATLQGGLIHLDNSTANDTNPAVSKGNAAFRWMNVWQRTFSIVDEDIYGNVIRWDGVNETPTFPVDTSTLNQTNPSVSSPIPVFWQYLVAFEMDNRIGVTLANFAGETLHSTTLETLGDNPFDAHRSQPAAESNGEKFIVGYSERVNGDDDDFDLYTTTLCRGGSQLRLAEMHRLLDYGFEVDHHAAVASTSAAGAATGGNAVFAWTHGAAAGQDSAGIVYAGKYQPHASCCVADVSPATGDGSINIDDLLTVISQWSVFCQNCSADVNGDLSVDIDDLLAVIAGWGQCQ